MKRFIFGFLAIFFLIFNILPSVYLFADGSYTNTQYAQVGSLLFSNLITSGEATELDFSDYTGSGTDLLIALGEMAVTGDVTGLVEYGLDWLGDTADDIYQNAIESIREWEYNIAPNLYNWWYNGTQYEFKLEPVKASGIALRKLLTPPSDSEPPQPDPDYSYIANINNFYIRNYLIDSTYTLVKLGNTNYVFAKGNFKSQSITSPNLNLYHVSNSRNDFPQLCCLNGISTIQVYHTNGENVSVTYSTSAPYRYALDYNGIKYAGFTPSSVSGNTINVSNLWNYNNLSTYNTSTFTTLNACMQYLYQHYTNINLYVNDIPWILMDMPSYPIVIDDLLTVLNDQPAIYNYPDNTYIDLSNLQTIITDAIDNSNVLTYNDIKPVFVDVNGQEAVAVVQIYRNDYDNMYPEQLPLIILPDDENYFSIHLLDTSKQYLQTQVDIVENTVDVLPSHLVGVLAIGCILTIFACIIHRLLE